MRPIKCLIIFTLAFCSVGVSAEKKLQSQHSYSLVESDFDEGGPYHFKKIYDNKRRRFRLIKDTVIIKFKDGAQIESVKAYLHELGLELVQKLGKNTFLCKLSEFNNNDNLVSQFNSIKTLIEEKNKDADSLIESFDLNEYKKIQLTKIDKESYTNLEWHLDNDGINGYKKDADANVYGAWEYTKGSGSKIAVIDTGIDPKLKKRVNIQGRGINARIIDQSISLEKNTSAVAPKDSRENHATAIIGIINARGNDQGLMGVAPESTIIPIRLIDDYGISSTAQIVYAFHQADELGAQIINCSWGSSSLDDEDSQMELSDIEKDLYEEIATKGNNGKGILIVFASGNKSTKNLNHSPEARYEHNFSVAASDSSDMVTSYSNLGAELDIIAPGGDLLKPIYTYDRSDQVRISKNGNKVIEIEGYNQGCIAKGFKGTSAAAAIVSGTAALVYSVNPDLNVQEIKDILMNSTDPIECPILSEIQICGAGRVNASKAVENALKATL